jgi:hypothetical protein
MQGVNPMSFGSNLFFVRKLIVEYAAKQKTGWEQNWWVY